MIKKIVLLIFVFAVVLAPALAEMDYHYKMGISYIKGNLSYKTITVGPSEAKLKDSQGDYIAEIVSNDNITLNLTHFGFSLRILYDTVDNKTGKISGGGMIYRNESNITLYLPYYENAKEINIYDENLTKKLTIDISQYSKKTAAKEEANMSEVKNETGKVAPEAKEKLDYSAYIIIGLWVIALIIALYYAYKKKK